MNILIVEDDPASLQVLSDFVETMHMNPLRAKNGKEGLALFRQLSPTLVITDVVMPELGGLELLSAIKEEHPETCVIVVTAHDNPQVTIDAFKNGASYFLNKPLRIQDIYSAIQRHLDFLSSEPTLINIRALVDVEITRLTIGTNYGQMRGALELLTAKAEEYLGRGRVMGIRVALLELLKNAIDHGNLEISREERREAEKADQYQELLRGRLSIDPYRSRKVKIEFSARQDCLQWRIEDEGKGFDCKAILNALRNRQLPDVPGRGITLAFFQMDRLQYEEEGRRVVAEKQIPHGHGS